MRDFRENSFTIGRSDLEDDWSPPPKTTSCYEEGVAHMSERGGDRSHVDGSQAGSILRNAGLNGGLTYVEVVNEHSMCENVKMIGRAVTFSRP